MAWIESHQTLANHPKTRRFARAMGIDVPAAIGHLHLLWWWAMDYAQDGDLTGFEPEDIADALMWAGDPAALVDGLTAAGFLEVDGPGWRIHDWDDYAGRLIEKRAANAERAKRSRDVRAASAQRAGLPNQTVPNRTEPSEAIASSGPPAAASKQQPLALDAASSKRITAAFREEMRQEFPELDEEAEFDRATNHVSYRKAIDKRRYYRNWLKRARDFAAERRAGNGRNGSYRTNGTAGGSTDADDVAALKAAGRYIGR